MASAEDLDIEKTTMAHFMGRPPRSNLVKEKQPRERSLKKVTFGENEIQDDSKNQKNFIQTVDEYRSKRDSLMNTLAEFRLRHHSPQPTNRTQRRPPELQFDANQSSILHDPNATKSKASETIKGLGLHFNIVDTAKFGTDLEKSKEEVSKEQEALEEAPPQVTLENSKLSEPGSKANLRTSQLSAELEDKENAYDPNVPRDIISERKSEKSLSYKLTEPVSDRLKEKSQSRIHDENNQQDQLMLNLSETQREPDPIRVLTNESTKSLKNKMMKTLELDRYLKQMEDSGHSDFGREAEKLDELVQHAAELHAMPIIQETAHVTGLNRSKVSAMSNVESPQQMSPVKRIINDINIKTRLLLDRSGVLGDAEEERRKTLFDRVAKTSPEKLNEKDISGSMKALDLNSSFNKMFDSEEQQAIATQIKFNLFKSMATKLAPLDTPKRAVSEIGKTSSPLHTHEDSVGPKTSGRGTISKFNLAEILENQGVEQPQEEPGDTSIQKPSSRREKGGISERSTGVRDPNVNSEIRTSLRNEERETLKREEGEPSKHEERESFKREEEEQVQSPLGTKFFKEILSRSNVIEALQEMKSELYQSLNSEKASAANRLFKSLETMVYKSYRNLMTTFFTKLATYAEFHSEKWIPFVRIISRLEDLSSEEKVRRNCVREGFKSIKQYVEELTSLNELADEYRDKSLKAKYFLAFARYSLRKIAFRAKVEDSLEKWKKTIFLRAFRAMSKFAENQQNWLMEVRTQFGLLRAGYVIQAWQQFCLRNKLRRRAIRIGAEMRQKKFFKAWLDYIAQKKKAQELKIIAYSHIQHTLLRKYFSLLKVDPKLYKKTKINFDDYDDYIPLQICIKNKVSKIIQKETNTALIANNKSIAINILRPYR